MSARAPRVRVGINLCRVDPRAPEPAEHALVAALQVLAAEPPEDIEPVLFTNRAFAAAHPALVAAFESHAAPIPPRATALRVAVELSTLRAAAARARIDVFHDAGGTAPGAVGAPLVLSVNDLAPLERPGGVGAVRAAYHRRAVPRALRDARSIVVPSAFLRSRLVDHLGIDGSRIEVVPWPLPPHETAAPIGTVRARHGIIGTIVLLAAATRPEEDHVVALRAMQHLVDRHKDTTLVLLGEVGSAERTVQRSIGELGLQERVVRLPSVSGPVRSALFEHAAVVISAADYGGFADAVLEAMACGVPVVVTDAGAAPELVEDAGAVVPPGDHAQLALQVHRVLGDPSWREGMARAGLDRAREHTPRRTADGLLAAYRSVLAGL